MGSVPSAQIDAHKRNLKKQPQDIMPVAPRPLPNGKADTKAPPANPSPTPVNSNTKPKAPWYKVGKSASDKPWYEVPQNLRVNNTLEKLQLQRKKGAQTTGAVSHKHKTSRVSALYTKTKAPTSTTIFSQSPQKPDPTALSPRAIWQTKKFSAKKRQQPKAPDLWFVTYTLRHRKLSSGTSSRLTGLLSKSNTEAAGIGGSLKSRTGESLVAAARKYLRPGELRQYLTQYSSQLSSSKLGSSSSRSRYLRAGSTTNQDVRGAKSKTHSSAW